MHVLFIAICTLAGLRSTGEVGMHCAGHKYREWLNAVLPGDLVLTLAPKRAYAAPHRLSPPPASHLLRDSFGASARSAGLRLPATQFASCALTGPYTSTPHALSVHKQVQPFTAIGAQAVCLMIRCLRGKQTALYRAESIRMSVCAMQQLPRSPAAPARPTSCCRPASC